MKTQATVLILTKVFNVTLIYFTLCFWGHGVGNAAERRLVLREGWWIRSSSQVEEEGDVVSTGGFTPEQWHPTSVPSTVLNALIENKVYPDMRVGLNSFRIPDASDRFNQEHDLSKYSHLPDKRNPWKDPYWYRTEFDLPNTAKGRRVWLDFQGINYRADVWLNGRKVADHKNMVGIYRRFRFDITESAKPGEKNCLAVKVHPVDHPGVPETQLVPFGKDRKYFKEIQKDVTFVMGIGYDCMPTVPDRNMGIWQKVSVDWTGPIDIRDPKVVTDLPLPKTDSAVLTVSAELVNATQSPQKGVCRGRIVEDGVEFEKQVELAPGESRRIVFSPQEFPQLVLDQPRLWWPRNYGPQNLYHMQLTFGADGKATEQQVTFAVREVSTELHKVGEHHGLRMLINGQKVFCQGGWLQPEILFNMSAKRMEAEVRYLAEANLTTVTFEDLPVPCDEFLEACDRYGLLYWTSFYSTYWVRPGKDTPTDKQLLAECAVDVIRRYWNHPSVVLYSCVGEGVPAKDVYLTWRKNVLALDQTRHFIPTIDVRFPVEWLKKDVPTGLHDELTFDWVDPIGYYEKVRAAGKWMFNTEVSIASLPPVSSLRKFVPDSLNATDTSSPTFPADEAWAHHGATQWIADYGPSIRRLYGSPRNAEDFCWKSHLVTATQHRAWSEAANHRMWEITSGIWQWKLNSCWPSVGWQVYDWYLKPMVSYYYYKSAFEPLHVQLSPLDNMVTVVNRRLRDEKGLQVSVKIYDFEMNLKWEKQAKSDAAANGYQDVFTVPDIPDLGPVYFAKLLLTDSNGQVVSENFYWLSSKQPVDYTALNRLPMVKLDMSQTTERRGDETIVHVRLKNPSDHLAFFTQLAITKGPRGDEVLPVFWDDNYFSLLPGESKEVNATFATEDLHGTTPTVEVGGWNIETDYRCTSLATSKTTVKIDEPFTVTAKIANTFLDASRIVLYIDNRLSDSTWAWARDDQEDEVQFTLTLPAAGEYQLKVGDRHVTVKAQK